MISTKYKPFFNRIFNPIAKILLYFNLTPNQITLFGLGFGILACLLFVWTKNVVLFCVLLLVSGLLDAVDGAAARLSGRVTKFGAYLDAVCDRFFEGFAVLSVAIVTGYWVLMFFLFMGMMVTSYAKARAAIEVPISNSEWPDFMERTERGAIFLAGLFISHLTHIVIAGKDLFFWVSIFLILAVYATVVQRIFRAKSIIETREQLANNG